MKIKFILSLSVAAIYCNAQVSTPCSKNLSDLVTAHVDSKAEVYVDANALFFVEGGTQIKNGLLKNLGRIKIKNLQGNSSSVFKTLKEDCSEVTADEASENIGGVFINKLNEPTNYALTNYTSPGENYTYGQLWIDGISQSGITGIAKEEYRNVNHGAYQQIALPFFDKTIGELSRNLSKNFSQTRWSMDEILKWDNTNVVFDHYSNLADKTIDPSGYYILGNGNSSIDLQTITRTVPGKPYSDLSGVILSLQNAGKNINYGIGGNNANKYREKYNTYLQDGFEIQLGGTAWVGNFGKNLYQYGNPFLTNVNLLPLFTELPNLYGIRVEQAQGTISYKQNVGGGAGNMRYVTWNSATSSPVGDVDWLILRPLSVFTLKLTNDTPSSFDISKLRTFNYATKTESLADRSAGVAKTTKMASVKKTVGYSNSASQETVKQLGVIALDSEGKEIGRTYYVVSNDAITGHSDKLKMQIAASKTNVLGTYEELREKGGFDPDYTSKYWLYINEANQRDHAGKAVPMVLYNTGIKSLKFEIRENAGLLEDGEELLSSNKSFYYQLTEDKAIPIAHNNSVSVDVPVSGLQIKLYYDRPTTNTTMASEEAVKPQSRTMVVFNPELKDWIVRFDPDWKNAQVKLFDMSGRLLKEEKNIKTISDYVIKVPMEHSAYMVVVIGDTGVVVNSKILK